MRFGVAAIVSVIIAVAAAEPPDDAVRAEALQRASVRLLSVAAYPDPLDTSFLECRFVSQAPTGTTPKFDCLLADGQVVKVKYGRNPEIHAEAAGTRLLTLLGFPADDVTLVRRVRCHGCPRFPFLTMRILHLVGAPEALAPHGYKGSFTDFEWVSVERRFPWPVIESATQTGWAWWELKTSSAPRAELDALRLMAVFLAHWDNKAENQRLVCVDPYPADNGRCAQPVALIQDLGSTFGPIKANLARWSALPIWSDARRCHVSMRTLPFNGATFPDRDISEEGRLLLARQLAALSDEDVRRLFADARFPEFYSGTDDARDLDAWAAAFRHRVEQIMAAGPCW